MRLQNTNPLGEVELPLIGRKLAPGEEFDVPTEVGERLLEQVGNYTQVKTTAATRKKDDTK